MGEENKQAFIIYDKFGKQIKNDLSDVLTFEDHLKKATETMKNFKPSKNNIEKSKKELDEIRKAVQEVEQIKANIKLRVGVVTEFIKDSKPVNATKKIIDRLENNGITKAISKPINNLTDKGAKSINKIPDKWDNAKDYIENSKVFKVIRKPVDDVIESIKTLNNIKIYAFNNDKILKRIAETKKAVNGLKKNVAITIAAKNTAKESINNIKKDLKAIVSKPFNAIIKAKDQTKSVIDGIKKNMESLKKIFNSTIGEAMKREDSFMSFKTNFKNEKVANEAFEWVNNEANNTQFKSSEVRDSVAKLAARGLDYKEYFTPLGNLATANNKSMNEAIEAMSKLSGGNLKDATSDFTKLGITKDMWQKQGIKLDKDGTIQGDSKQAMDAAVKIMNSNWNKAMENRSSTATGQIKNIKESLAGLGANLVGVKDNGQIETGGVFDTFKQQLSKILPLLDAFKKSDAFKVIQKDLNELVKGAGSKFSDFIGKLMKDPVKLKEQFNKLWPSIYSGISAIAKLGSAAASIAAKLGVVAANLIVKLKPLFDIMAKHPNTVIALFTAFKIGIPVISSIVTAFTKFKEIKKDISLLSTSIQVFTSGSKSSLLSLFKVIMKSPITLIILAIIAVVIILYKAWTENWGGIQQKAEWAKQKIGEAMDGINKFIQNVKGEFTTFEKDIKESWNRLIEFFSHPIDATVRFIKEGAQISGKKKSKAGPQGLAIDSAQNALGTSYFSGGWTWVGEQGPELMKLPGGTQILDNRTSQNMLGGSLSIEKLADTLVVREDADIDRIADALAKKLTKVSFNYV